MNATVQPNIFDIRSYEPKGQDAFLVDTNAWYWVSYTRASLSGLSAPRTRQKEQYNRFLKKALDAGSTIARCDLSLAELAHRIEISEKQIYQYQKKEEISLKAYRTIPDERERVVSEIKSSWSVVTKMSEQSEFKITREVTAAALETLKTYLIGGYDIFHLEAVKQKKLIALLTDDGDFFQLPEVTLYTCNESVLRKAAGNGRLVQ